jgi:hypothetical protein
MRYFARQLSEVGTLFFKIRNRANALQIIGDTFTFYFTLAGRGPKVGQIPGFVRPTSRDGDLSPYNLDVTFTPQTRFTA